ncbi:MAG: glycosyltransferase family 39 protein, partial [Thermoanaerobaculales bacterium]|nr:glycosyltransferase family 39 protein [Thermoanaerobaculales bacterium]
MTPRERFQGLQAAAVVMLVAGLGFVLVRAQWAGGFGVVAVVCLAGGWIGVWTLAALGAGRPVARWVGAGDEVLQDDPLIAVIAGAGVLVACAAVLSVFGWFRPIPLMIVLVGWAAFGSFRLKRSSGYMPRLGVVTVPLLGLAGIALLVAATVSPFYDQWHQHLGFPWIWLADGSVHPIPRNWYSYMPVNASMLYGYGLRVLGPWSAQAIHWWCGVVTVLAVARLAGRAEKRSAATYGVIVLATTPTFLRLMTVAGSDLVVAVFAAGSWLGLLQTAGDAKRAPRWWVYSGVCVGLAIGAKYTAIGTVALPIAAAAVALHRPWRGDRSWTQFVSGGSLALVSALAAFTPWAVRNLF